MKILLHACKISLRVYKSTLEKGREKRRVEEVVQQKKSLKKTNCLNTGGREEERMDIYIDLSSQGVGV